MLVAVAVGCVTGVFAAAGDVGVAVGCFAGVFEEVAVAVGPAGGFVVSPASDAVGFTFAVAVRVRHEQDGHHRDDDRRGGRGGGQRHRRSVDGGLPRGTPRPPGTVLPGGGPRGRAGRGDQRRLFHPGPRPPSTRVAATESAAPGAGTTGSSVVGLVAEPGGSHAPAAATAAADPAAAAPGPAWDGCSFSAGGSGVCSVGL